MLANRFYLCHKQEETVNHLFLHCEKMQILWNLTFNLFEICFVWAESVRHCLAS